MTHNNVWNYGPWLGTHSAHLYTHISLVKGGVPFRSPHSDSLPLFLHHLKSRDNRLKIQEWGLCCLFKRCGCVYV